MFYADFILSKKGNLGRIWLAAHWDKKLTKKIVMETDIEKSVDGIIRPQVKLALRTSGHLLLGVVRIYSRKVKCLLNDYNDVYFKVRMAFRPHEIDLSDDTRDGAVILPEAILNFEMTDFDLDLANIDLYNRQDLANITMPDCTPGISFNANHTLMEMDDYFGFDDIHPENALQDVTMGAVRSRNDFFEELQMEVNVIAPTPAVSIQDQSGRVEMAAVQPASFREQSIAADEMPGLICEQSIVVEEMPVTEPAIVIEEMPAPDHEPAIAAEEIQAQETDQARVSPPDSFILQPAVTSEGRARGRRRRRRLIVDVVTSIPNEDIKGALRDTSDIIRSIRDVLPPPKDLLLMKEMTAQKFLTLPGRSIPSVKLMSKYVRHLSSRGYDEATGRRAIEVGPEERPAGPQPPTEQPHELPVDQLDELPHDEPMITDEPPMAMHGVPHDEPMITDEPPMAMHGVPHDEPMITDEPPIATNGRKRKLPILEDERPIPGEPELEVSVENPQEVPQMPTDMSTDATVQPVDRSSIPHFQNIASSTMIQPPTYMDTFLQNDPLAPLPDSLSPNQISQVTSGSPPEEQAANETIQQFSERVANRRAAKLCSDVKGKMQEEESDRVVFKDLIRDDNRRTAAQKFYSLLVLKKQAVVEVEQNVSYGDIYLTPGQNFENFQL